MNLDENLVKLVTKQPGPKTPAARLAKNMGLVYMGFGRYADKSGKVKYTVDKQGNLIPFKSGAEIDSLYREYTSSKWNDLERYEPDIPRDKKEKNEAKLEKKREKVRELKSQIDQAQKQFSQRRREDRKIIFFKQKEEKRIDNVLRQFYKRSLFNKDELSALNAYTGSLYDSMNEYLYRGHDPQDHGHKTWGTEIHKLMVDLDRSFDGTEAPFGFPVYTGLGKSVKLEHLRPGSKYIFRGYLSTSVSHGVPIESFAYEHYNEKGKARHKVVLQIDIKKGDPGIYIPGIMKDISLVDLEKEFLLPRGTMLEILSGPHAVNEESIVDYNWHNDADTNIMLFHCRIVRNNE